MLLKVLGAGGLHRRKVLACHDDMSCGPEFSSALITALPSSSQDKSKRYSLKNHTVAGLFSMQANGAC